MTAVQKLISDIIMVRANILGIEQKYPVKVDSISFKDKYDLMTLKQVKKYLRIRYAIESKLDEYFLEIKVGDASIAVLLKHD